MNGIFNQTFTLNIFLFTLVSSRVNILTFFCKSFEHVTTTSGSHGQQLRVVSSLSFLWFSFYFIMLWHTYQGNLETFWVVFIHFFSPSFTHSKFKITINFLDTLSVQLIKWFTFFFTLTRVFKSTRDTSFSFCCSLLCYCSFSTFSLVKRVDRPLPSKL